MALEELPSLIYSRKENGIALNLFTESEATVTIGKSNKVDISQKTAYPFDGNIQLTITPSKKESFPIYIRIPDWAKTATIKINNKAVDTGSLKQGEYFILTQNWAAKSNIEINFPFDLTVVQKAEEMDAPQNAGQIYRVNWFAVTRGPLVYAVNSLIDGKDRERALKISPQQATTMLSPAAAPSGVMGPVYELKTPETQPLLFVPYYQAGGMKTGGWRLTWLQSAID